MAISREVLKAIDLADKVGTTLDVVLDLGTSAILGDPADFASPPEEIEERQNIIQLVETIVEAKRRSSREFSPEAIDRIGERLPEKLADEYFTRLELKMVPGIVRRWRVLRAIGLTGLPNAKVTDYLRQAINCYLHGLPTAASILCRSVLQFSLEEALSGLGGIDISKLDKRDWLKTLINCADRLNLLAAGVVEKAHRIRKIGNRAVHKNVCEEREALTLIRHTGDVLSCLYRTSKLGR